VVQASYYSKFHLLYKLPLKLQAEVENLQAEVVNLQAEVVNLQAEVVNLQAEVVNLQAEVVNLQFQEFLQELLDSYKMQHLIR
jgi:uncharacterized protein YlxW (UPF0749 family)